MRTLGKSVKLDRILLRVFLVSFRGNEIQECELIVIVIASAIFPGVVYQTGSTFQLGVFHKLLNKILMKMPVTWERR